MLRETPSIGRVLFWWKKHSCQTCTSATDQIYTFFLQNVISKHIYSRTVAASHEGTTMKCLFCSLRSVFSPPEEFHDQTKSRGVECVLDPLWIHITRPHWLPYPSTHWGWWQRPYTPGRPTSPTNWAAEMGPATCVWFQIMLVWFATTSSACSQLGRLSSAPPVHWVLRSAQLAREFSISVHS